MKITSLKIRISPTIEGDQEEHSIIMIDNKWDLGSLWPREVRLASAIEILIRDFNSRCTKEKKKENANKNK